MSRTVSPEILDSLEPDDPRAIRNRREINRLNRMMGNHQWLLNSLQELVPEGSQIIDLGAGDITFYEHIKGQPILYSALDRVKPGPSIPQGMQWITCNIESFEGWEAYNVITANLFLHQLTDEALGKLGSIWNKTADIMIFNEPLRHPFHRMIAPAFLKFGGYGLVTQHDGLVSIEAGFRGGELPGLLGLGENWKIEEHQTLRGSYRMIATRK